MRILVSESHPGAADEVARRLAAEGHDVTRSPTDRRCCTTTSRCPLDRDDLDVVVDVRSRPVPVTASEQPLMCAVLARVPRVICGPVPNDHSPWLKADVRCDPEDAEAGASRAVEIIKRATRRRVRRAVADVLRPQSMPGPERIEVAVRHGPPEVRLAFVVPLPATVQEELSAAVRATLTSLTRHWGRTRVVITTAGPRSAAVPADRVA